MRRIAATLSILALALGACSDDSSSPSDSFVPTTDGGQKDQYVPSGDTGPSGPGTACTAENTMVVYENADGRSAWQPQIAWSGTGGQYGITWAQEVKEGSTIKRKPFFARVGSDGTLKGQPKALSDSSTLYTLGPPVVSAINVGFAAFWSDTRDGDPQIYMLRMNEQGEPMQGANTCSTPGCGEVKITDSPAKATMPYVARRAYVDIDGPTVTQELALAWRDARNRSDAPYPGGPAGGQYDIYFKVVQPGSGNDKVAETRITADTTAFDETESIWPRIVAGDQKYVLVWQNGGMSANKISYKAINGDGTGGTIEELVKPKGSIGATPDLVWADNEFGISFTDAPSSDTGIIRFARIAKDGNVMAIQQVNDAGKPCGPAVAYNGKHYALAWQDNCGKKPSRLQFALIAADGTPIKPDGTSCSGSSDPKCGLVQLSPESDAAESVHSFPEMISVGGRFAITWMNAPKDRVYFSHVVCK